MFDGAKDENFEWLIDGGGEDENGFVSDPVHYVWLFCRTERIDDTDDITKYDGHRYAKENVKMFGGKQMAPEPAEASTPHSHTVVGSSFPRKPMHIVCNKDFVLSAFLIRKVACSWSILVLRST